jgi:hypothetical protein
MGYASLLGNLALLCSSASLVHSLPHADIEKRLSNGLALTPPMGYVVLPAIFISSDILKIDGIHIIITPAIRARILSIPMLKRSLI